MAQVNNRERRSCYAPYGEKKKLYPEYRRARDEMRELLTVKANIDRLLNMDTKAAEKENERGQR